MQAYSRQDRETDPHALPDVEVYQLTAEEVVQLDSDLMWDAAKRFPLATMNSQEREKAIAWAVEQSGAESGWYYHYCFPGCLPDSEPMGPYKTQAEALEACREENAD